MKSIGSTIIRRCSLRCEYSTTLYRGPLQSQANTHSDTMHRDTIEPIAHDTNSKLGTNEVKEVIEYGDSYTVEEEKAVLRKIDLAVLPMVQSLITTDFLLTATDIRSDLWRLLSAVSRQAESKLRFGVRSDHRPQHDELPILMV